jgi:glutathione S-transferase
MRLWTQLPDSSLHAACGALSVAVAWRHQMIASGLKQLDNRPNYGGQNDQMRAWIQEGVETDRLLPAVQVYDDAIAKMAKTLRQSPWLAGDRYSLADAAMTPYVCRLEDLGLSWFWEGDRAPVGAWLERVKARPNYSGIRDYLDLKYVALTTAKGTEATPRLREMVEQARNAEAARRAKNT